MKRTKNIHHAAFRKSWNRRHLTSIALAITTLITLAGCEQSDEAVTMFQNADDCTKANPSKSTQCTTAYQSALKEAEKTAPKYTSRADCVAEFGEHQCQQTPAQASMGTSNQATAQQSGNFWMPLMAGYMMGRMMNGGNSQPLFTSQAPNSPANGKFVDAAGRNYGTATPGRTTTVPKSTMAPKPATTSTVTRGGFGESVAKQTSMQSSNNAAGKRSFGG